MDDADVTDVADFEAPAGGESEGPAWSELPDGHGAGSGARQFRDDITGAALPLSLLLRPAQRRFGSWNPG
eukprot:10341093-Alexandrium_andersonii.AAC.1